MHKIYSQMQHTHIELKRASIGFSDLPLKNTRANYVIGAYKFLVEPLFLGSGLFVNRCLFLPVC